jgi:hypothetical protein
VADPTRDQWDQLISACDRVIALGENPADAQDVKKRRTQAKTVAGEAKRLAEAIRSNGDAGPALVTLRRAHLELAKLSEFMASLDSLVAELGDVVARVAAAVDAYPNLDRSSWFRVYATRVPTLPAPQTDASAALKEQLDAIATILEGP